MAPFRITVSKRGLKNGTIELKRRSAPDLEAIPAGAAADRVAAEVAAAREAAR